MVLLHKRDSATAAEAVDAEVRGIELGLPERRLVAEQTAQ
jgi:hypothetical protein